MNWFKLEDVIEIRTERLIPNPIPAIVEEDRTYSLVPRAVKINSLNLIKPSTLHLWVDIPSLRIMPVNAECDVY